MTIKPRPYRKSLFVTDKKDDKRWITVPLTRETYEAIDRRAEAQQLSRTSYARMALELHVSSKCVFWEDHRGKPVKVMK